MGFTSTSIYKLEKPNVGQERDTWGAALNGNFDILDHIVNISQKKVISWTYPYVDVATIYYPLGYDFAIIASTILTSISPVAVTTGNSRIRLNVNAGVDLVGDLIVTGTSRHSVTGTLTVGDTESLSVSGINTYVTAKYWTGPVTLSTTNLDISDLDVHEISWFSNNGRRFSVRAINHQVQTKSIAASSLVTLTKAIRNGSKLSLTEVIGGLLDVVSISSSDKYFDMSLEIPSLSVTPKDEGIILKVVTSGAAGDIRDLRLNLYYENQSTL